MCIFLLSMVMFKLVLGWDSGARMYYYFAPFSALGALWWCTHEDWKEKPCFPLSIESFSVIYSISQLEEPTQASHHLGLEQASSNSLFKSFWNDVILYEDYRLGCLAEAPLWTLTECMPHQRHYIAPVEDMKTLYSYFIFKSTFRMPPLNPHLLSV